MTVRTHTILSVFPSIGKILEGREAAYLLFKTKISACGSMNTFLSGKLYSRRLSGTFLLETAMHELCLERFIEDMNIPLTNLLKELENWANGGRNV